MYEVTITHLNSGRTNLTVEGRAQLVALMGDYGSEFLHDNSNPRQRAEMQGEPVFSKASPQWAGERSIRYEMDLRPAELLNQDGQKVFVAGREYGVLENGCMISFTVARRTAKTITTQDGLTLRISLYKGVEYVAPRGRSNLSPVVRAASSQA